MKVTFDVAGLRDLDRSLRDLSDRGVKNAKRAALRKGAQHLRKEVKAKLPRTVGEKIRTYKSNQVKAKGTKENVHLRNRIGFQILRNGDLRMGYVGLARAYGHIIEFGDRKGVSLNTTGKGVWSSTIEGEAQKVIDISGTALGEAIIKEIERGN